MLLREEPTHQPPSYLEGRLPTVAVLATALEHAVVIHPAGTAYCRVAGDKQYVLPPTLTKAHRFGPPRALYLPDGTLPFTWLYVALDMPTAIWEGQFALSDATTAGSFYLNPRVIESGVLARITLSRELRLWDLTGEACSKLGIFDTISSRDHEACQWIGYHIREAMRQCDSSTMPDGFLYPSRRVRGRLAIALSGDLLPELQHIATVEYELFKESAEYDRLLNDPLRAEPPNRTTSLMPG